MKKFIGFLIISIVVACSCVFVLNYVVPFFNLANNPIPNSDAADSDMKLDPKDVIKQPGDYPSDYKHVDIQNGEAHTMKNFGNIIEPGTKNVLLIGIDENKLYDTIIILNINQKRKEAKLISLPRDTYVEYDDSVLKLMKQNNVNMDTPGRYKLNGAPYIGRQIGYSNKEPFTESGINFFCQVLKGKFGVEIHDYIYMDFDGFEGLVDAMGGMELTIPEDIYLENGVLFLSSGYHEVDGAQALLYARLRHKYDKNGKELPTNGDTDRKNKQLQFIQELARQMLTVENIPKAGTIMNQLKKNLFHSINLTEYTPIAMSYAKGDYKIATYLITGVPTSEANYPDLKGDYVIVKRGE